MINTKCQVHNAWIFMSVALIMKHKWRTIEIEDT